MSQTAIDCDVDMVSIFIPTSELHVRLKFKKPREQVLEDALGVIDFARDHGVQVRFAAEDASRTDLSFLKRGVPSCVRAWCSAPQSLPIPLAA